MVIKFFENLVNDRIVEHLEECGLFLNSNMVLQLLLSYRITRAFNRSEATRAVALDISKPFDRV